MASLSIDPRGNAAVYVKQANGARKPVRLGRLARPKAETIRRHLEHLEAAALHNVPAPAETRRWVEGVADTLRRRMAGAGLCDPPAERQAVTLGAFGRDWLDAKRATVKPRTIVRARQALDDLTAYFGADRLLTAVTAGDADDWKGWLRGERPRPVAEATARKRVSDARELYRYAIRKGVVSGGNPFGHLSTGEVKNGARVVYVSEADARRVLDELQGTGGLSTAELRAVFVLSRWGGLRIPSEAQDLTWDDIDWAEKRLTVKNAKTAGQTGEPTRVVPLFPEVEAELSALWDAAPEGSVYVCPYLRAKTGQAFTKPIERAIKRAGLERWPKLLHQLRGCRQTDLTDDFPTHVVCRWLGNTPKVAERNYLRTTDEHFEKAVRIPVRAAAAPSRGDPEKRQANRTETPANARECVEIARVGFEPTLSRF